ncbi:MAG: hypothetical protein J3R72DRAFT_454565 [Linnemannia gamsii]|nr:MAG: hypothetical protein J3R72DRAFT_454565 [Linnemannia gamsii]
MARITLLFTILVAVAAMTLSSALPTDPEVAAPPYQGAWCNCYGEKWNAHCGACTKEELWGGCHNDWSSTCH